MIDMHRPQADKASFELRFESLFDAGRGLAFPCDAAGRVELESLSERARHNLQRARELLGREFAFPVLRLAAG
jgi:hypothetical protein